MVTYMSSLQGWVRRIRRAHRSWQKPRARIDGTLVAVRAIPFLTEEPSSKSKGWSVRPRPGASPVKPGIIATLPRPPRFISVSDPVAAMHRNGRLDQEPGGNRIHARRRSPGRRGARFHRAAREAGHHDG